VQDYITLDQSPRRNIGADVISAFEYTWVNTELATLAGGRAFFEFDRNEMVTWFGQISYVEGRDHTRRQSNSPIRRTSSSSGPVRSQRASSLGSAEEPLPVIPPLETAVGLRIHDDGTDQHQWLVEFLVRIVGNQDRVATSLSEQPTPSFTTVDIRGFWSPTAHWRLSAGVENVGNLNYQEHFDPHRILGAEVFQLGRNFFFGSELVY
jgi:outer membrane receptor protein involved in Fe transport